MAQSMRFGRRLALPSTRQIIHELRVLSAHEAARKLPLADPTPVPVEDLAVPPPGTIP